MLFSRHCFGFQSQRFSLLMGYNIQPTILDKKCHEFCSFLHTGDPPCKFSTMVTPSPTPPWSMLFSRQQKCSGHTSTLFFGGRGGSILSEPGFRGKYSKIKHTTCIFLNIFVQDCSISSTNQNAALIIDRQLDFTNKYYTGLFQRWFTTKKSVEGIPEIKPN